VFQHCKKSLGEILSAFEFMDAESMNVITDNIKLSNPISSHPFYILIETSGTWYVLDRQVFIVLSLVVL